MGTFKLLHRKRISENARFDLFYDDIDDGEGEIVRNYLVVAPKNSTSDLVTGVAVFPVFEGRIGLLKVYRHPIQAFSWEIPRGFLDPGEGGTKSALRELEEETGLTCPAQELQLVACLAPEGGTLAARVPLYIAPSCRQAPGTQEKEWGHRGIQFFTLDEVAGMVSRQEIQDPYTLVGYYHYRLTEMGSAPQH